MTSLTQRENLVNLVQTAVEQGARLRRACEIIGISIRTHQRWYDQATGSIHQDQRPLADRPQAKNKLRPDEVDEILAVCAEPVYASLPPSQIVPKLADQGVYIASESSFYRVLKNKNLLSHRGHSKAPQTVHTPTTHIATAINQVWTWDITYLPSTVRGQFFYLYMVQDLSSRYGVAWEVYDTESGEHAALLFEKACWSERLPIHQRPVLHQDNGSVMKSLTLRAKLNELGIKTSYSRPRVSDDNPYIESFFRTLKYVPNWPRKGFASLEQARAWVHKFMHWYHHEHQHSGIKFVTPAQRHRGEDKLILANRVKVYEAAKSAHPERWSGNVRDWSPITEVQLNPEKIKPSYQQIAA